MTARGLVAALALAPFASACHGSSAAAPVDGGWSEATSLPVPRFEGKSVVVAGKVLYVGGITGVTSDPASARESDRIDVYDPATRTWSSGPSLPADGPMHHLALAVMDDRLYVLGGFTGILGGADAAGVFTPSAVTYVLEGSTWTRLADQPVARGAATAEAIGGIIYVAGGGVTEPGSLTDLYGYDPATDTWNGLRPMPTMREHVASCVVDGRMIVVGGWMGDDRAVVATAEAYDPATDQWTHLADMPTARGGLGAVAIGGTCFAIGGEEWVGSLPGTFANVEALDVDSGAWTTIGPMRLARHGLGVTALGGMLYAVGGGPIRGNSYTDDVETKVP
jgi:non-specific serine/threonine protein kinase